MFKPEVNKLQESMPERNVKSFVIFPQCFLTYRSEDQTNPGQLAGKDFCWWTEDRLWLLETEFHWSTLLGSKVAKRFFRPKICSSFRKWESKVWKKPEAWTPSTWPWKITQSELKIVSGNFLLFNPGRSITGKIFDAMNRRRIWIFGKTNFETSHDWVYYISDCSALYKRS